jgi:hypothetical protein
MVAVGKVFENQGRYDAAEAMYRSALRRQPQNPVIHQQLSHLQAQRSIPQHKPDPMTQAIQLAQSVPVQQPSLPSMTVPDSVSAVTVVAGLNTVRADLQHQTSEQYVPSVTAPAAAEFDSAEYAAAESAEYSAEKTESIGSVVQVKSEASELYEQTAPAVSLDYGPPSITGPVAAVAHAEVSSEVAPVVSDQVTLSEVMVTVSAPNEHLELLLLAVRTGDCVETQTFAAALLGECDVNNKRIRDELSAVQRETADPGLLLAIADTQIHRGEADEYTAETLSRVAECTETEYQVQAITSLRHFVRTSSERSIASTLRKLLTHPEPDVRSSCAVTLGDFVARGRSIDEVTLSGLSRLASTDENEDVRVSARAALLRRRENAPESAEAVIIRPAAGPASNL